MALKPTIYKFTVNLSDFDRNIFDSLNLVVAQHPSENLERVMARVIAYLCNVEEHLSFTTGLSTPDEPDIWVRDLSGQLLKWIDVGEPQCERIKKAARKNTRVSVYSFNKKSDTWWQQNQGDFAKCRVDVYQLDYDAVAALANSIDRVNELTVTVSEGTVFIHTGEQDFNLVLKVLQKTSDD